jgi:hypothetical protein
MRSRISFGRSRRRKCLAWSRSGVACIVDEVKSGEHGERYVREKEKTRLLDVVLEGNRQEIMGHSQDARHFKSSLALGNPWTALDKQTGTKDGGRQR